MREGVCRRRDNEETGRQGGAPIGHPASGSGDAVLVSQSGAFVENSDHCLSDINI